MPLRCALVFLLLAAAAEGAELHVAVLPFSGPRATAARQQIVSAVCEGELTCVSDTLVRKGKPDWERIRAKELALVVTGKVTGQSSARVLEVELLRADESSLHRQSVPLNSDGKIASEALEELDARVLEVARSVAPPAPSAPTASTEAAAPTPPSAGAQGTPPAEGDVGLIEPLVTTPPQPPPAPPPASAAPTSRPALIAIEGGIDVVRRTFRYGQLESSDLREYETAPAIPAPRIRIEVHPLAGRQRDALAALALEVDVLAAIGVRTINPDDDQTYDTQFQRFDVGVSWSAPLLQGGRLRVGPGLAFRYALFEVGTNAAGESLAGLADVRYRALRGGVGAEYALGRAELFLRADYIHPFALRGIDAYFPALSGAAFEVEAGVGFRVTSGFGLVARAHYGRYALSLNPEATAVYRAGSANDDYLGLAVLMRYQFGAGSPSSP